MKRWIGLLLPLFLLAGCVFSSESKEREAEQQHEQKIQELVAADRAFSEACGRDGMRKAFLQFMSDDAVLLRPDMLPIVEGDVVRYLSSQEDSSFTMSWEVKGAELAASYDLGYTFGVYKVAMADTTLTGTYLNIWRKQPDGQWKVELDTGNSGTGN